ncbi:GapA-binding peptide SR1P [Paenibacillus abyssi]|uniref:GapA-binding peptide SR1P n=1 Tax=Paenibacillus abyssi TaxID=1340531 RepID=A0A917LEA5_9BACL|nr:GapA-binding peptide SR1P [Paenibacillus abyssi]GGG15926.1 hypothetical protein GCM10010916_36090 [Paenibacillus abyssi]
MDCTNNMIEENGLKNELGTIICKRCGTVFATIPTNGYKLIYGICQNDNCQEQIGGENE